MREVVRCDDCGTPHYVTYIDECERIPIYIDGEYVDYIEAN